MDGLEGGEVVEVVGEPEPDVIGTEEVRVLRQSGLFRIVPVQVFR